jgi:hypothetical protein
MDPQGSKNIIIELAYRSLKPDVESPSSVPVMVLVPNRDCLKELDVARRLILRKKTIKRRTLRK